MFHFCARQKFVQEIFFYRHASQIFQMGSVMHTFTAIEKLCVETPTQFEKKKNYVDEKNFFKITYEDIEFFSKRILIFLF